MSRKLKKSLCIAFAAVSGISMASAMEDNSDSVAWLGKPPDKHIITNAIDCDDARYVVVTENLQRNQTQLIELTESGAPVAENVFAAVSRLIEEFVQIDGIIFSCGDARTMIDGTTKDFTGELSTYIYGKSIYETEDAKIECSDADGYYDDVAIGAVVITKEKVVSKHTPNVGECIVETEPPSVFPRPETASGEDQ